MQQITPFLWFNDNAEEAMNFYVSLFENSKVVRLDRYGEAGPGPKGSVMTANFMLEGQEFIALNGGPLFTFTPAISFFVNCASEKKVNELFHKLSVGGEILMPLDKYPFSEKFGWLNDKFGVSWQVNLSDSSHKIVPFLMFVGQQHGKAEEAINLYTSLFKNSRIQKIVHYGAGETESEGTVKHATYLLNGQEFMALDSNGNHNFTFSLALSFVVNCETQDEVDDFWEKLSEGGEKGRCGWLKDKFGVSWQIIPTVLGELLRDKDPARSKRVMEAMLKMDKIDINALKQARDQLQSDAGQKISV